MDGLGRSVDQIKLEETQDHSNRIDDSFIAGTDSSIKLGETQVRVRLGERTARLPLEDAACARQATEKAITQVRQVEDAAAKGK